MRSKSLLQLIYISTAAPGLHQATVSDILKVSRNNNAAAGVTGLLLFDGYRFLQALEGEQAMVNATYQRIKADPRHRAVVLLSQKEVTERAFGDWAMAAQRVAIAQGETVAEMVDRMTAEVGDLTMRELFRSFARVRQAA
jgi:GrpB-like predicted nucleotidyltransferase (UPF0157 family)